MECDPPKPVAIHLSPGCKYLFDRHLVPVRTASLTARPPIPAHPRLGARLAYRLQRALRPRPGLRRLGARIEASGLARPLFTGGGAGNQTDPVRCRMCGQCALPVTGYACPMTCPKQLRNGPCGGVARTVAARSTRSALRLGRRTSGPRPPARRLTCGCSSARSITGRWGESSWLNYWQGRDEGCGTARRPAPLPSTAPGTAPATPDDRRARIRAALAAGRFAVTAEIGPPRGADAEPIGERPRCCETGSSGQRHGQPERRRSARKPGRQPARSEGGVAPIMQLPCRDRNRSHCSPSCCRPAAIGIPNILIMTGDHPRFGDHADAKPVFDLDSVQLLWRRADARDRALLSGRGLEPPPHWFLGAVENPFAPR